MSVIRTTVAVKKAVFLYLPFQKLLFFFYFFFQQVVLWAQNVCYKFLTGQWKKKTTTRLVYGFLLKGDVCCSSTSRWLLCLISELQFLLEWLRKCNLIVIRFPTPLHQYRHIYIYIYSLMYIINIIYITHINRHRLTNLHFSFPLIFQLCVLLLKLWRKKADDATYRWPLLSPFCSTLFTLTFLPTSVLICTTTFCSVLLLA